MSAAKRPGRVRTYTVTATVEVEEYLDSSWHKPFTDTQAKRLVADISGHKGWNITGGAYTATVTKVSTRKVSTIDKELRA